MNKFLHRIFTLTVVLLCIIVPVSLLADEKDSRGKDFWFTFIPNLHVNSSTTDTLYVYVVASVPTSGTLQYRGRTGNWTTVNFTINDPTKIFKYPIYWLNVELQGQYPSGGQSAFNNQVETAVQNVFNVTSDNEVTVYALNQASTTSDAFLVLPTDALGTDHYVLTYNSDKQGNGISGSGSTPSQFAIVSTQDSTDITILPSVATSGSNSTSPILARLNKGQSFLVQANVTANNGSGDLTGSRVQSSKPIALFAGQQRARIPINVANLSSRDHIVEQIPSVDTWGRTAIVIPFPVPQGATTLSQDLYRVLAAYDSTDIFINGVKATTLFKGGMYQSVLTSPQVISSNKSILVSQYKKTSGESGSSQDANGDPFMMLVPPSDQFQSNYRFISVQAVNVTQAGIYENGYEEQWITVVMPVLAIGSTVLDGQFINAMPNVTIMPIPGTSSFVYAWIRVSDGVHSIYSTYGIGIYVYGYGKANSYGYVGGMSFRSFDFNPPNITGIQECSTFKGMVYDTVAGDSRIVKAFQIPGSAENIQDINFSFTSPQDSLPFEAKLIDPYQDGKVTITAIDSVSQQSTKTINVKGFTVATNYVKANNKPESIFIKTPVDKEACTTITIENYGKFDQIVNPTFAKKGASIFSVKGTLPITLKPGEKKSFDICVLSTQETLTEDTLILSDGCINRELALLTVRAYSDKTKPVITIASDSCKICFTMNITDSTEVDAGLMVTNVLQSYNMDWAYNGALNDAARTITFCVIDPYKDAVYSVEAKDKNGNISSFQDTIPGFTLSVSPIPSQKRNLGGKAIGGLYCDSITVKNTGLFPQYIDAAFLAKNIEFSVPQSQLPITVLPGNEIVLRVCYSPSLSIDTTFSDDRDRDTVRIGRLCTNIPIIYEAFGIDDIFDTLTTCQVRITSSVIALPELKISNILVYPQPASLGIGKETLEFILPNQTDLSIILHDVIGSVNEVIYEKSLAVKGHYTLSFALQNRPPGMYVIEIQTSSQKEYIPFIISH